MDKLQSGALNPALETGSPVHQAPSLTPNKGLLQTNVCPSILSSILLVVIGNSAKFALTATLNLVPSGAMALCWRISSHKGQV